LKISVSYDANMILNKLLKTNLFKTYM